MHKRESIVKVRVLNNFSSPKRYFFSILKLSSSIKSHKFRKIYKILPLNGGKYVLDEGKNRQTTIVIVFLYLET